MNLVMGQLSRGGLLTRMPNFRGAAVFMQQGRGQAALHATAHYWIRTTWPWKWQLCYKSYTRAWKCLSLHSPTTLKPIAPHSAACAARPAHAPDEHAAKHSAASCAHLQGRLGVCAAHCAELAAPESWSSQNKSGQAHRSRWRLPDTQARSANDIVQGGARRPCMEAGWDGRSATGTPDITT